MSLFGTHLTILAGTGIPLPLAYSALEALDSIEISSGTSERSGMQAQFKAGRGSTLMDIADYPIMNVTGLKAGSRIIVLLTLSIVPQVLFDGIVTQSQLSPGQGQGDGTLAVTAEDIRVKMDQTERDESYPGMPVGAIAAIVMARYAQFGLVPTVIPPLVSEVPLPMDRVMTQSGSDLSFLNDLAQASDYIFTVSPGPAPGMNMGYFGPQPRLGLPQSALTINMGPDSNVSTITFQQNATDAHQVVGEVQDRTTNTTLPVRSVVPLRVPLATEPAILNLETVGERRFRSDGPASAAVAMAQAQAASDRSTDVVTAEGELDGSRYGKVLLPRQLVGVRGVGRMHDGLYFVNEVKHMLKRGEYKQKFKLTREGTGTTTPVVMP